MAIQDRLVSYVQRNSEKKLEEMYGKKIGKTASNGARTFQQKVIGGKTVTTGVSWDNKVISQVSHIGDVIKSTTKKIRYNKDGDIVEVSHSRRATNVRNNVRENIETGDVESKVFNLGIDEGKYRYQVSTNRIDSRGNVDSSVKNVKLKGKNSPLE